MSPNAHRFGLGLGELGAALAALALLGLAGSALAGEQGGNLAVRLLELELGGPDRFVLCDDANGNDQCDEVALAIQDVRDRRSLGGSPRTACELVLDPPFLGSDPPNELVSIAVPMGTPGIDVNKGAIGDKDNRGTGCGQLEQGEALEIEFLGRGALRSVVQFEAKQNVAAEISFWVDVDGDGTREQITDSSGQPIKRFLISGTADPLALGFPALGDPDLLLCNFGTPDGNPDSGERDDCLLYFSRAGGAENGADNPEPFHDLVRIQIANEGALSLKAGSEFADPEANRSRWTVAEFDGVLACGDGFSCANDPECTSDGVTGNRTDTGTGDACGVPIPYALAFDGTEVTFEFRDPNNQDPAFALDVEWQTETAQFPIEPTLLSYDTTGVCLGSCDDGSGSCTSDADCTMGGICVVRPETCIPLTLCVGTPIRRCSNDPTLSCEEDADCGPGGICRLEDLVAPAGGFPDLVAGNSTTEYGCICEEDVLYLGGGLCDANSGTLSGASCEDDTDCLDASGTQGSCVPFPDGEDRIAVEQCVFFVGDPLIKRSR